MSGVVQYRGFHVGDDVVHKSADGGMGRGKVVKIDEFGVHVGYERKSPKLPATGIYGDEWFRNARASLVRVKPEGEDENLTLTDVERAAAFIGLVMAIDQGGGECGISRITGSDENAVTIEIHLLNFMARRIIRNHPESMSFAAKECARQSKDTPA